MRGEPVQLSCPFCDKGKIQAWYIPGAWGVKRKSTKTLPGKGTISRSSDIWLIKSDCPVCGKSEEEVEKELRRKGII